VLDTVAQAGNSCVVLPWCVVDEPAAPGPARTGSCGLADQARERGLEPRYFARNFRGQRLGFSVRGDRPAG
jgi:hypothetical protein